MCIDTIVISCTIAIQLQKVFKGSKEKEKMNIKTRKSENISSAMIVNNEEDSSENFSHFELLPLEIQEAILSYLPAKDLFSVAKTSRSLTSLTKTQSLWTKLTLDWKDIYENLKFCKYFIRERYGKMRSAEITKKIKNHTRKQDEEFDCKLATIMDLIFKSKTLTSLKVDKKIELSDSLLSQISEKSSFTRVDLTGCWSKTRNLSPLSTLTNLHSLKLYSMGHINSEEIDHLFSSMRNLKIVEVPNTTIQDSSIACLVKNNVNLNHLVINYCRLISSKGIKILAKACPNIQHVSMKKCEKLREVDALQLLSSCPELRHVGLSRVSDKTLRTIHQVCPKMQSVSLEHAWVTERGITQLLTSAPKLHNMEFIEFSLISVANNFDDKFKIKYPACSVSRTVRKSDWPLKI